MMNTNDSDTLKSKIETHTRAAGFDVFGVVAATGGTLRSEYLARFLDEGRHGDMTWLAEHADRRAHPQALWPKVQSVIVLGMNYGPQINPLSQLEARSSGAISVYAQGGDYHQLIKRRLRRVARWLAETSGAEVKIFVDTAPVLEKPLAQGAGLGWQGKHTNLVARGFGSWLFLGEIFTTLKLPADTPEKDHCGGCQRCLDVCPTNAFPAPYELDPRRCISYLSIEHKGHIDREFRKAMGNRIFGCDDCLAVCPWNKFAQTAQEARFIPRESAVLPALSALLSLDEDGFRARFKGSPVKRAGRDRFLRNVLIAAGNSGDKTLIPAVISHLKDASPLVRAMAVWALSELAGADVFHSQKAQHLGFEKDLVVAAEWTTQDRQKA